MKRTSANPPAMLDRPPSNRTLTLARPTHDPWMDPPEHCSAMALALYHRIMATYDVRDTDGRVALHTLIRSFDRAEAARAQVEREGATVVGQAGVPKAHPLLAIERAARAAMLAALKTLDIKLPPSTPRGR